MNIRDALTIEGTSKLGILCYGVFPKADLDHAVAMLTTMAKGPEQEIFALDADEWPNAILLRDVTAPHDSDLAQLVTEAFDHMFAAKSCLAAACLYDGAFFSYEDILGPDAADQTYAYQIAGQAINFAGTSEVMKSGEWSIRIAAAHVELSRGADLNSAKA
jgi:hypothetical protein